MSGNPLFYTALAISPSLEYRVGRIQQSTKVTKEELGVFGHLNRATGITQRRKVPVTLPHMKRLLALLLILSASAVAQQSSHVFIVMLENRSDSEAMKYMPYLSGLAKQYSRALEAYSPSHGSFLAYLELTTG